jgi:hypothetical protein
MIGYVPATHARKVAANAYAEGMRVAEAEAARHAKIILGGATFYGEETTVDTHELLNFCRQYLEKPRGQNNHSPVTAG